MARWTFNGAEKCNGAIPRKGGKYRYNRVTPIFEVDTKTYCPDENSDCGQALLGSKGHLNTPNFNNAICLFNFYGLASELAQFRDGAPYDPESEVWNPNLAVNFYVTYELSTGKQGCLSSFALKILQKDASRVNFRKQGVAVYRDGVLIYNQTQNITAANINATPLTFTFPNTSEFCSDGSKAVKFEIVFGLVRRLVTPIAPSWNSAATGYDDITINGTCGGSSMPTATATKATCPPAVCLEMTSVRVR